MSKTAEGGNPSKLRKIAVVFCAAALAGANAKAAATYTTEDDGTTLVVTVDSDGATMDASKVTAGITKIKKEGPGTLTAVPLSTYTGDFSIEEGVYSFNVVGDFGVTRDAGGAGVIDIKENAKILHTSTKAGTLSGKTINLYGGTGANLETSTTAYPTSMGKKIQIVLRADATIKQLTGGRPSYSGTVHLGGHTLTLDGTGQMIFTGKVSNDGVDGGKIVCKIPLMTDYGLEFDAEHPGVVELPAGKSLYLNTVTANGWKIEALKKGTIYSNIDVSGNVYDANSASWDGPIELVGSTSLIACYNSYFRKSVLNVKGVLSGSGALRVGPGWLNLHNPELAYSGAVSVIGTESTITNYGGIGVFNGAPCFTNSPSITFSKGARFGFMDDVPASVPELTFVGDSTQSIFGGSPDSRSTIAGIVKSDDGVLEVKSPVHVTGTTKVNGGTLRVPFLTIGGVPGLVESHVTPKSFVDWTDVSYIVNRAAGDSYRIATPWSETHLKHLNVTEKGVSLKGARRAMSGFINTNTANWDDGWCATVDSGSIPKRNAWWYSGYVWNRSDAPVTNTVWMGTSWGGAIWLGEDHSTYLPFKYGGEYTAHGEYPSDAYEIVLQPGATRIDIVVCAENTSLWSFYTQTAGQRRGLIYAPSSVCSAETFNNLIVDLNQNPSTATTNAYKTALANFSEFRDESGTGLLFTANLYGENEADKLTEGQPVFDNIEFSYGTTFDLAGNTLFNAKDITGSPVVTNAVVFGITNNWTICAADFPADDDTVRHPMTVDGKLVFTEGSTLSIDEEAAIARVGSGLVIATAEGGITGTPQPASGLLKKWKLVVSEDGKNLRLHAGSGMFVIIQ